MRYLMLFISCLLGSAAGLFGMSLLHAWFGAGAAMIIGGILALVLGAVLIILLRADGYGWDLIVLGFLGVFVTGLLSALASRMGVSGLLVNMVGGFIVAATIIHLRNLSR